MRNQRHPRRPHPVDGRDEVQAREDGGKTQDEDPEDGRRDIGRGLDAVGGVKGPARVGRPAVHEEREEDDACPGHIEPPGEAVDPREGHVLGPDQDGEEDVTEGDGDPRNDEQEDLDDAVEREELVVGLLVHEPSRRKKAEADHEAQDDADGKEGEDRHQVHDADPFMVGGHHPLRDNPPVLAGPSIETGIGRHFIFQCHRPCPFGIFAWKPAGK